MKDNEQIGSVRMPTITLDRTPDGRRVYIVDGRHYTEVPVGPGDAYRFLAELRLEMTGEDFRAFIARHRPHLGRWCCGAWGWGPRQLRPKSRTGSSARGRSSTGCCAPLKPG